MKAYKYFYSIGAALVILGVLVEILHIKIGISGKSVIIITLIFGTIYQNWLISKLTKQIKDKELQ